MTPLHYAAKAHQAACVKLLIDSGANVNALNMVRIALSNLIIATRILYYAIGPRVICQQKRNTPLHLAAGNFQVFMLPSWNTTAYECIKLLACHPEMNLSILNLVRRYRIHSSLHSQVS